MLRRIRNLEGLTLAAVDGHAGRIRDIYFDDETWRVRYFVADTSPWPTGIAVAIPPARVTGVNARDGSVEVDLTKTKIERNPLLDDKRPVSSQLREHDAGRVGGPMNWGFPGELAAGQTTLRRPHLRSARHVTGFRVHATDGALGQLVDLMVDDTDWSIPYLITGTNGKASGLKLLSTGCVDRIEVAEPRILTRVSREDMATHGSAPTVAPVERPDLPELAGECRG